MESKTTKPDPAEQKHPYRKGEESKESRGKEGKGKKESIMELAPYMGKEIQVKLLGGRDLKGILRGYDQVCNLVIDQGADYKDGIDKIVKRSRNREETWTDFCAWTFGDNGGANGGSGGYC